MSAGRGAASSLDARLLRALRGAAGHLPAAEAASQLGVSEGLLHTRIKDLQAAGFVIEERPAFGLRLLQSPDRLMADDLAARLGLCPLVREMVVFAETDSTNDLALARGREGASGGLVIFAERQRAGRGRFGRRWESAAHLGLWFSLLLRPAMPVEDWPQLTTWAAAGIAAALERSNGVKTEIKWPNDLLQGGKKVAGVLIESGSDVHGAAFAVLGIGVNVNHDSTSFPAALQERAGSLRLGAGELLDRAAVAVSILEELQVRMARLGGGFAALVGEASQRSSLLGEWIAWQAGGQAHEGRAEALDERGQLMVRLPGGAVERLCAGEVTMLPRPAR